MDVANNVLARKYCFDDEVHNLAQAALARRQEVEGAVV